MPLRYNHEDETQIKNFMALLHKMSLETTGEPFFQFDDSMIRYFNDICPMCRERFKKNYRNEITNMGEVGYILLPGPSGFCAFYVICKKCSRGAARKMATSSSNWSYMMNKQKDPKEQMIEKYIYECLQPTQPRPHNISLLPKLKYEELIFLYHEDDIEEWNKEGYTKNSIYLDHFNTTCPACKCDIPIDVKGELDVPEIWVVPDWISKSIFVFALCFECHEKSEYDPQPKSPLTLAFNEVKQVIMEPMINMESRPISSGFSNPLTSV